MTNTNNNLSEQLNDIDNVIELRSSDVNVNVNGEVLSFKDIENIFFLYRINPSEDFISAITGFPIERVNRIVNSLQFQETINQYMSAYLNNNAGESLEALYMRYATLLKDCFISLSTSVGMKIRKANEARKPLEGKALNIPLIEKLMRLEFALKGMPIDIKAHIHTSKKKSQDKTDAELLQSMQEISNTLKSIDKKSFSPSAFVQPVSDAEIVEEKEIEKEIDLNQNQLDENENELNEDGE